MSKAFDFKKEYRDLYLPPDQPMIVEVPEMKFIMVEGSGDPSGQEYAQSVELLYALSYAIKMSKMDGNPPEGYFEYSVPPLEGLWDCDGSGFNPDRESWKWVSMIRQPDFVNEEVFQAAAEKVRKSKPELGISKARLTVYNEGLSVQAMHHGPYSGEQATIDRIVETIAKENLIDACGTERWHHEIYLSDPRRTTPEKLKTVLRHPVNRKG